jgi:hypothetical protein
LGDWLFESTEATGTQLWAALKSIHDDLPRARARVRDVMAKVSAIQHGMTEAIGRAVNAP